MILKNKENKKNDGDNLKTINQSKLKITIIVFSPSGNTLATAKLLKQSFLNRDSEVQLINFTGRREVSDQKSIAEYLENIVNPHDILCIGGPVYSGHLQENVKKIINALPLPDKKWSTYVIPFVTYGGVHSSVALKEAGNLLRERKRKNILGMKIASSHSLTRKDFPFIINESKPGKEESQIVEELTKRVVETSEKGFHEINDISSSFSYISFGENLLYKLLSEKTLHKIMFNEIKIDHNKCIGCGICAKKCPVQIIEMKNKKASKKKNQANDCTYCSECYQKCKFNAISFNLSKPKRYLSNVNDKKKFEFPQSKVYPL